MILQGVASRYCGYKGYGKKKKKSVIVVVGIGQGSSIETIGATTHKDPVYIEEGVLYYYVANILGIINWLKLQHLLLSILLLRILGG